MVQDWNQGNFITEILRGVNTACTIATVLLVIRHYWISMQLLKAKDILRASGRSFFALISL